MRSKNRHPAERLAYLRFPPEYRQLPLRVSSTYVQVFLFVA